MSAAEIEGAVVGQVRALLRQPEVVNGTWIAARADDPDLTEAEVREALHRLDPLREELFPAEQARIVRLLVERAEVGPAGATFGCGRRAWPAWCAISPVSVPRPGGPHDEGVRDHGLRRACDSPAWGAEGGDYPRRRRRSGRRACPHGPIRPWSRPWPGSTGGSGCWRAAATALAEPAAAEKIDRSYLGKTLRLNLLAPDIVDAILDGRQSRELVLPALLDPLPSHWDEQRSSIAETGYCAS